MNERRAQGTLFLTVFVDLLGFGIIIPLLPFYAQNYGADPFQVTLLMATYSLVQFVFAPLWGRASDRVGRKPVLTLTLVGLGTAHLLFAWAGNLWLLFAARALAGAMAGNIAAAQAYIADVTPPDKRAQGMGLIGAAFGLGFTLGPAIGGLLAGSDPAHLNVQAPALTAAALSWLAAALAAWVLPAPPQTVPGAGARRGRLRQLGSALQRPELGLLVGLFFLQTFAFAGLEGIFALWSERRMDWGPAQNGYLFAFIGLLGAAVQGGLIGRLRRRFGERALVRQGLALLGLGLALAPLAPHWLALLVPMAAMAYGLSVLTPSLNSLISTRAEATQQGQTFGLSQSAASLARILGPAWAGALFSAWSPDWPFWSGALMAAVAFALSARLSNPRPQEAQ